MLNQIDYMSLAIKEAIKARKKNEVPVGAIIVGGCGKVIAKAHNLVETRNDPTCHAEKLVIGEGVQKLINTHLKHSRHFEFAVYPSPWNFKVQGLHLRRH